MKVGLVGFSGSGKTTVFQWLTGVKPDPAALQRGQVGIARIPDERLDWLSRHFKPKKTTHATLEFVDTPGLLPTERADNPRRLAILREAGGLLVVLTGFSGDPVPPTTTRALAAITHTRRPSRPVLGADADARGFGAVFPSAPRTGSSASADGLGSSEASGSRAVIGHGL